MFDFDTNTGEIWLYDTIGPSWAGMIDSASVHEALRAMGSKDITLRVSSPGGSVFDAVDIYNMLERYSGNIIAEVDGLAASAASFLILAANEVRAAKNATFMIHRAWSVTMGDAEEHQRAIGMLETVDENIVSMYAGKSGKDRDEILSAMSDETWMSAQQALEWGLIDSIIGEDRDAPQTVPDGMYAKTPAALVAKRKAGSKTSYHPKREALRNKIKLVV